MTRQTQQRPKNTQAAGEGASQTAVVADMDSARADRRTLTRRRKKKQTAQMMTRGRKQSTQPDPMDEAVAAVWQASSPAARHTWNRISRSQGRTSWKDHSECTRESSGKGAHNCRYLRLCCRRDGRREFDWIQETAGSEKEVEVDIYKYK
jgi:hypothetical protein